MKRKNLKKITSLFIIAYLMLSTYSPVKGSEIDITEPSISVGDVSENNITPESPVTEVTTEFSQTVPESEITTTDVSGNDVSRNNTTVIPDISTGQATDVSGNDFNTNEDVILEESEPVTTFGLTNVLYTDENGIEYTTDDLHTTIDLSISSDGSVVMYIFNDGLGVIDGVGNMKNTDNTTLSTVNSVLTKVVMTEDSAVIANTKLNMFFKNCINMTSISLPNLNTTNTTTFYAVFEGCSSLTSIDIKNWNTANATTMQGLFSDCSSLETVDLSNFNTTKVTSFMNMFYNCHKLIELNINHFDTTNIKSLYNTFINCSSLVTLDLSSWNTENVTNMCCTFSGCSALMSLNLSNWNNTNVTNSSSMFRSCFSLKTLNAPKTITTVMNLPFTMYTTDGNSHTKIELAEKSITYYSEVPPIYTDTETSSNYYEADASHVIDLSLNQDKSVVMYVFDDGMGIIDGIGTMANTDDTTLSTVNSVLTKVVMSGDSSIIAGGLGNFFCNCSNLTYADLSNLDTSNTVSMSCMFQDCSNLKTVIANNWNTSKVESVANMFAGCTFLTTIDTTNWDTSSIIMMSAMFSDCSNLATLDVSNWDTSKATSMVAMFQNCRSITVLDVSNWDTSNVTLMNNLFSNCSNLTVLDVSNWNTSKVTAINGMFGSCSSIKVLDVSNFDTSGARNFAGMFVNCSSLEELDLTNFTINSSTLTLNFASNCPNLNKIILGENTTSFMSNAFTVSGTKKVVTTVVDNSNQTALTMDWASMNRVGPFEYNCVDNLTGTSSVEDIWSLSEEEQTAYYESLPADIKNCLDHCYKTTISANITPIALAFTSHEAALGYTGYQSFIINENATSASGEYAISEKIETADSVFVYQSNFCCCDVSTPFYTYETILLKTTDTGYEMEKDVITDHILTVSRNCALEGTVIYTICYILAPCYTTTIPTTICLDKNGEGYYDIAVNGTFPIGNVIITPEDTFFLHQDGKEDVVATVTQEKTVFSAGEEAKSNIKAQGLSAGKWTGSFSLNITTTYIEEEWQEYLSQSCPNYH